MLQSFKHALGRLFPRNRVRHPIVIYQMGKVGSSSVYEALLSLHLDVPVHHCHLLNQLDEIERAVRRAYPNPTQTLVQIEKGRQLRDAIERDPRSHWDVISLVRDPVARNVSAFFENLPELIPDSPARLANDSLPVEELQEIFLHRYSHDAPVSWFDLQLKPVFGIEVLSTPFPRDQGFCVYSTERTRLLLLRAENLESCFAKAMNEFLGIANLPLGKANTAGEKQYGALYEAFIRGGLPPDYLASMYGSRVARHFYANEELERFAAFWSGRPALKRSSNDSSQRIAGPRPLGDSSPGHASTMHPLLVDPIFAERLARIDRQIGDPAEVPRLFESIPLDVFGLLLLERPDEYPGMQRYFPRMPPDDLQQKWVGATGEPLLRQSVAFVRAVIAGHLEHGTTPLAHSKILDYGCGWGRLLRLFYKYIPEGQIYGVDAWEVALKIAANLGVRGNLALIDPYPEALPFPDVQFDLIFSFSVLTHLSERAQRRALAVWHRRLSDGGLLAVTIRPRAYWNVVGHSEAKRLMAQHEACGFAHAPILPQEAIDGDMPYGNTSIDIEYMRKNWSGWRVVRVDVNLVDAMQVIVFLKKT